MHLSYVDLRNPFISTLVNFIVSVIGFYELIFFNQMTRRLAGSQSLVVYW